MSTEVKQVEQSLRKAFATATDIYIDPVSKECEVTVSIDDFQGEIMEHLFENGVSLKMVDYCDAYPFKYVFNYSVKNSVQLQD
jgi:hypothetical protein